MGWKGRTTQTLAPMVIATPRWLLLKDKLGSAFGSIASARATYTIILDIEHGGETVWDLLDGLYSAD